MGIVTMMSAAKPIELISPDAYLEGEAMAKHKHEFAAGRVYMMAGAGNAHNRIATAFIGAMHTRLRGKKCEAFNSDTKVRVRMPFDTRFYYPDGMVVCNSNPPGDSFQDQPVIIVEVLSTSTRRIDEGEKLQAYLSIPTLTHYLMIETTSARVVAYERDGRGGPFVARVYEGLDADIPLPAVHLTLPLSELYERVDFTVAQAEEDARREEP